MKPREYTDEFIAQVRDLAVIGLLPVQIAERLKLEGSLRRDFLFDINSSGHPLYSAFYAAQSNYEDDVMGAIQNLAAGGDTKAQETWVELNFNRRVDRLKMDLFGI